MEAINFTKVQRAHAVWFRAFNPKRQSRQAGCGHIRHRAEVDGEKMLLLNSFHPCQNKVVHCTCKVYYRH